MSSNGITDDTAVNTSKRKHDQMMQESTSTSADGTTTKVTVIQEGSATMSFPSTEESTVFYNPVQVQNRDLSILMITLFAERRAIQKAMQTKKRELHQERLDKETFNLKLQQYEQSLNGTDLLLQSRKQFNDDNNTGDGGGGGYPDGITILDALAASGLRSIRYWKEIPGVRHVTINDLEKAATERAHDNLKRNQLDHVVLSNNTDRDVGICVNHGDATHEMYLSRKPQQQPIPSSSKTNTSAPPPSYMLQQQPMWDVIDLDPYGSAAPFLDAAVQAVENGGMLCITCTDMAALGGSHPETAYGRYAALPIQSAKYLQELALRILLYTISVSAARYGRTIRPILSVGMDFYVRVFVEIRDDKRGVTNLSLNIGNVYQSSQCSSFVVLPHGQMGGNKGNVYQSRRLTPSVCPETGANFKIGGPLWLGPLHDQSVIRTALQRLSDESCVSPNLKRIATRKRLEGLLTSVSEELDTPLYYTMPGLCQALKCTSPSNKDFKAALINAGYKVSGYHKEPTAIKTDAPDEVVWDIMRAWVERHPLKKEPQEGSAAAKILAKQKTIEVDFTMPKGGIPGSNSSSTSKKDGKKKVSRFPNNPESHWGPKRKASGKRSNDES
ncbi:S-adenosyl-L-methionine-dependent methyltransferase [Nitzschia inconspicua]|uniref:tRNA (guanine(26)-N(2))-dimethyltransferase n=1 Tax=Nitzschia inconspicua TaxID=303405 RepID=A0A9K3PXZ0_9STRA|nr:S-adenosyl-L-methionine-dependent methyltransferase [Nitzschia inconspicua]